MTESVNWGRVSSEISTSMLLTPIKVGDKLFNLSIIDHNCIYCTLQISQFASRRAWFNYIDQNSKFLTTKKVKKKKTNLSFLYLYVFTIMAFFYVIVVTIHGNTKRIRRVTDRIV